MALLNASESKPLEGGASFSIGHRLLRATWNVTWFFLAAWTPPPMNRWRNLLLRCFGAKLHPTAIVHGSARIWYPPHLQMGAYACLGPQVNCYCMAPIELGEKAIVSQRAHLCAGTHDINDPNHQLITKPITLGNGVWIAAEAFIGPGVTVGTNAVIGARSVLFKDADSSGVYVGNPARLIRHRNKLF